eukprot:5167323-Prymnesium_polylepis.1
MPRVPDLGQSLMIPKAPSRPRREPHPYGPEAPHFGSSCGAELHRCGRLHPSLPHLQGVP